MQKTYGLAQLYSQFSLKMLFFCQELVQIGGKNKLNWFTKFTAFSSLFDQVIYQMLLLRSKNEPNRQTKHRIIFFLVFHGNLPVLFERP